MDMLKIFKNKWMVLVGVVFLLLGMGCAEKDLPSPPLQARFQLFDSLGGPSVSFRQGEDVIFDYRIVNIGNIDVAWEDQNRGTVPLFPVFRILKEQDKSLVGQVYTPAFIRFDMRLGRSLQPGEEVVIRATWMGNLEETELNWGGISYSGNTELSRGKYIVEFEHVLESKKFDDFHSHIYTSFEVF